ncbi:MAG: N-6 DNA methylase [Candidatus Gracilibacteria bacterium]|nr:N-6 DNA methylase [Candidatus Gracilibacteria bacterium]
MKTFLQAKQEFDNLYSSKQEFIANIPVNLTVGNSYKIKGKNNETNEEYYKWQFFYSLINSGLYQKDYIGCEVYFPKGNKNSAPIKFDGAIFDNVKWFDYYKSFHEKKDQESLDWLRKHLFAVIEFKKENSKDTETVYNQQLKPAMKESENNFCLGVLYDTERLYLFQKKNELFLRLDEGFNLKGEKCTTKDLSLHLTDAYYKIPSFEQLEKQITKITIDRSKRTIDDLEIVTGVYSKQLTDGISYILKVMDKVGMKNQRGYEILIQILALKIFDEKRSQKSTKNLDFYKNDPETEKLNLLFYITKQERGNIDLGDEDIQGFIDRLRKLYNEASSEYHFILKRDDTATVTWTDQSHIQVISEIVEQLQDYSFVKSHKTDLYQIVFYKFANEFSKADKGQFITPIPLIDFLVKIVNPRSTEKMIDPTVGIADFLSVSYVNSKSDLKGENYYGIDNDEQMIMLAQLNMLLNGDGNSILKYKPDKGSIIWKFDDRNDLFELDPRIHKNGDWDKWIGGPKLKKFDVVLTNPPFGDDRRFEPKTQTEKEIAEMYELWNIARNGNSIDLGVLFLENAYRILKENGRLGIIVSNSIASIDRWNKAREWLMSKMRIVALFDLPANVFADTGVNTTMIIAYKPNEDELLKLQESNYDIFVKDIEKVGYEVKTEKRVKFFNKLYKINDKTFEIEQDEEGNPLLDEDFTDIAKEFKDWCFGQEKTLQDLFIKSK